MTGRARQFWDDRSATYDAQFDRAPVRLEIMGHIAQCLPLDLAVHRVIDLGAGTGRLTEYLRGRLPAATFLLVDFSPRMLDVARVRLAESERCEFHRADFTQLPFPDDSVDLVVSSCALHHVDDEAKAEAIAEIARVLRPGGMTIIVDEAICDSSYLNQPSRFSERMREVFYPNEDPIMIQQLFAPFEEWPAPLPWMRFVLEAAGLATDTRPLNDILALFVASKPRTEEEDHAE